QLPYCLLFFYLLLRGERNLSGMAHLTYRYSESTDRFLCNGENPFKCEALIHTTELDREGVNGKFSISQDKGNQHFFVHIKNLSTDDSGIYWCGSDRTSGSLLCSTFFGSNYSLACPWVGLYKLCMPGLGQFIPVF
uniref:Immunoglobulin V-set domain-containing protein n=1 Tax=Monopterus albus TaxID=43700 RepID=A0A3Q3IBC1_MONAL